MGKKSNWTISLGILITLTISVTFFFLVNGRLSAQGIPPKREFRALWVTTLNNMDWPSKKGLTAEEQQREFIDLLEKCKEANLNALIVQIRPAADAFYQSNYEPWSEWISGEQGLPPKPYYDPLKFMIEESHKRNIELHAWLNPLRAVYHKRFSSVHDNHISNRKPEWVLEYGNLKMLNPGLPEVRDYITSLIADLIERYDVDGIHFDDYFYPYPNPNYKLKDGNAYRKYRTAGKDLAAWRRDNVNKLIFSVHKTILSINPRVKFGISPAGVWRNIYDSPLGSHTRGGYTSYDHLHADSRTWLQEGWVDYLIPQVYFSTRLKTVNYRTLTRWWGRNHFDRHLYIGHAAFKVNFDRDKSWYSKSEIPEQLRYNRTFEHIKGSAFFRAESFLRNRGNFRDSLKAKFYAAPALMPTMPWKDEIPARKPDSLRLERTPHGTKLKWVQPDVALDGERPYKYVVYKIPKRGAPSDIEKPENIFAIVEGDTDSLLVSIPRHYEYQYLVTSLDRLKNESAPAIPMQEKPLVVAGQPIEKIMFFAKFFQKGVNNYFGWLKKVN